MSDRRTKDLSSMAMARSKLGTEKRMGTIHQVWTKSGETLVRCVIGKRPDGSDLLTPWFKPNEFAGGHREERCWHKGQNICVVAVDGNFRTASLIPYDTNDKHKRPENAAPKRWSTQFGSHLTGSEAGSFNRELRKGGGKGGSGAGTQTASSGSGGGFGRLGGPLAPGVRNLGMRLGAEAPGGGGGGAGGGGGDSDKPVVFHKLGSPSDEKDKDQPWDGPDPEEKPAPQQVQTQQVGEQDKQPANTTMTPEHIVNQVGDKSALTVSKDNITAMVGGNGGMSPEMLKGLMGPIAAMIANTVGNKVSTQQVSSMASATVAAMAGQVMAGQETSASTWDDSELDDATAALITSQVGDLLNSTMLEDLIDAVNTEIHMILGDSFTVENESATQVADELVPIITSVVQDTLSSDEINHLAQNLGTTVITEAALAASNNALMNDTDSPPTIVPTMPMTTENMAIMSANIGAALNRAAGLPAPASGAGAGGGGGGGGGGGAGGLAGMMGGLQSGLMDKIKGLSGGSVMQLLPKQLNELTQNKFNMKSQQGNILQTAMQNITHKAKSKLALVGSPVTANTG